MIESWLISIPNRRYPEQEWKQLVAATTKAQECELFKFHIPMLKVGTLDTLLINSENLSKLEMYLEGLMVRLANSLGTAYNLENSPKLRELLLVRGHTIYHYLLTFKWDIAKFPTHQTIRSIADLALKQGSMIEAEYKVKFQNYSAAKAAFESSEKNEQGTLLTKALTDVVKRTDYISGSAYLATVFVVIPKKLIAEWDSLYERLDESVVPKSSRLISGDSDYYLVGVTLFKKNIPIFSENCRKFKFIVRQFNHDEDQSLKNKEKILSYKRKKDELFQPLVKMLKHYFCELYVDYIHVKASRMFVESVLRYGLPPNFRTILFMVGKKNVKKVREILYHLYKHLDAVPISEGEKVLLESVAALGHNPADYYPYVSSKVNIDII